MIELRWVVKKDTTTDAPHLQYRCINNLFEQFYEKPEWKDVPTEIEAESSK